MVLVQRMPNWDRFVESSICTRINNQLKSLKKMTYMLQSQQKQQHKQNRQLTQHKQKQK